MRNILFAIAALAVAVLPATSALADGDRSSEKPKIEHFEFSYDAVFGYVANDAGKQKPSPDKRPLGQ